MHMSNTVSLVSIAGRNRFVHTDYASPFDGDLVIASWNVEGLSALKLWELTMIMRRRGISILCIQEARISQSPYYLTDNGFLVILSGSSNGGKEFAGVGYIVAPWAISSVVGFLQFSSRLACLKLRVPGGKIGIICAYAPHGGYSFDVRQQFFEDLGSMYARTSVNKGKLIFGDLNSRIQKQLPGEEEYVGDYVFGNPEATLEPSSNRELLMEHCCTFGLAVANTFVSKPQAEAVTFRTPGTPPLQEINPRNFAVLDYLLIAQNLLDRVVDIYSCRSEALASQHFLLEARLSIGGVDGSGVPKYKHKQIDRSLLKKDDVALSFNQVFQRSLAASPADSNGADIDEISKAVSTAFGEAAVVLETDAIKDRRRPWISQRTLDFVGTEISSWSKQLAGGKALQQTNKKVGQTGSPGMVE